MQVHVATLAPRYTNCNSNMGIDASLATRYDFAMPSTRYNSRKEAFCALIGKLVPDTYRTEKLMAESLGFSAAHFSQMKSGNRTIGNGSADKIERGLSLGAGGLDAWADYEPVVAAHPRQTRDQLIDALIETFATNSADDLRETLLEIELAAVRARRNKDHVWLQRPVIERRTLIAPVNKERRGSPILFREYVGEGSDPEAPLVANKHKSKQ